MHYRYYFNFSVLQLRGGGHILVLLEHGLLHHRVSAGALAQGAQENVQKKAITVADSEISVKS